MSNFEVVVQVDEEGRVLLPVTGREQPSHYRVTEDWNGKITLYPMQLVTERTEPKPAPEPAPIDENTGLKVYTQREAASLDYYCPHCEQPANEGCVTKGSGLALDRYWRAARPVHKARLAQVPTERKFDDESITTG